MMKHCRENLAQYIMPKEAEFIEQLPKRHRENHKDLSLWNAKDISQPN